MNTKKRKAKRLTRPKASNNSNKKLSDEDKELLDVVADIVVSIIIKETENQ